MLHRREVVRKLLEQRDELLVVAGLGSTAWDVTAAGDADLSFPMWGAMGQTTARVLETMGVAVRQAGEPETVAAHVHTALRLAFEAQDAAAVLIAQRVIGIKSFQEQSAQ